MMAKVPPATPAENRSPSMNTPISADHTSTDCTIICVRARPIRRIDPKIMYRPIELPKMPMSMNHMTPSRDHEISSSRTRCITNAIIAERTFIAMAAIPGPIWTSAFR